MDTEGRELKLKQMYDSMLEAVAARPDTIIIESIEGKPEATYADLLGAISGDADM